MVGKNNQRLKNEVQQRQVFALRKLSVGVASVLLGTTCMFINNVHADTVENTSSDNSNNNASASANADASQPYVASESANMQGTAISTDTNQNTATGQSADQSAATNMAQVVSPAPNTKVDGTGDANQVQAAPAFSQETSNQQPVKVFNAVNTDNTAVNSAASGTNSVALDTTVDSPASDYQTFSTDQLNTNETVQPLAAITGYTMHNNINGTRLHDYLRNNDRQADTMSKDFYAEYDVAKERSVSVKFVDDEDFRQVGQVITLTGRDGDTVKVNVTVPDKYQLANGQQLPTTYTFTAGSGDVTIHLTHKVVQREATVNVKLGMITEVNIKGIDWTRETITQERRGQLGDKFNISSSEGFIETLPSVEVGTLTGHVNYDAVDSKVVSFGDDWTTLNLGGRTYQLPNGTDVVNGVLIDSDDSSFYKPLKEYYLTHYSILNSGHSVDPDYSTRPWYGYLSVNATNDPNSSLTRWNFLGLQGGLAGNEPNALAKSNGDRAATAVEMANKTIDVSALEHLDVRLEDIFSEQNGQLQGTLPVPVYGVYIPYVEKTATRTINVTTPDGKTTTVKQTATLSKQVNLGKDAHPDWTTGEWAAYNVPTIPGYTASQTSVAKEAVTGTTKDQTVNITYTANPQTGDQGHQAASWDVQSSYTDARGNVWTFDVNNDPAIAKTPNSHGWYYTVALKDVKLSQETLNSKSIVIPGGLKADAATDTYIDAVAAVFSRHCPRDGSASDPFSHPQIISFTIDPELVHRLAQQMETIKFGALNCSYNGDWTGVFSADSNRYAVGLGEDHPVNTVLKHVDMRLLDMSDVTSFKGLFNKCVNLEDVNTDGNNHRTTKLTNTSMMFNGCSALSNSPIGSSQYGSWFDPENVTDMSYMFLNANHLYSISGISHWNVSKVKDFHEMFSGCSVLVDSDGPIFGYFDLHHWNTGSAENMNGMFRNAGIELLNINNWYIPAKHELMFNGMGEYQKARAVGKNVNRSFSRYSAAYFELATKIFMWNTKVQGSFTSDDISMNSATDKGLTFGTVDGVTLTHPPLGIFTDNQTLADTLNSLQPRNFAWLKINFPGSGDSKPMLMPINNAFVISEADFEKNNGVFIKPSDFYSGGKYQSSLSTFLNTVLDFSKYKVNFDSSGVDMSYVKEGRFELVTDDDNTFVASIVANELAPEITVTANLIAHPRTLKVTFVDGNNNVVSTQEINGKTNEDTTGTVAFPPGYVLIPNANMDINGVDNPNLYPIQGNNGGVLYYNFHFRDDNTSPTLVVHVQPKVLTIDPGSPAYQNGQTMPDNPSLKFTGIGYNDLHKNVTLTATFILPYGKKINYNYPLGVSRTAYVNEANGEVTYGNWSSAQWDFSDPFNLDFSAVNGNIPNSVFCPVHNAIVTSTNGQDAQMTFNVLGQHATNTINVYDADDGNKLIKTITVSGISSVDRPIIDIASQLGRSANSFYINNNNVKIPQLVGGYNDELEFKPYEEVNVWRPFDSIGQQGLFRIKHLTGTQYQVDLVPNAGPESIYIHHAHENVSRNVQINWSLQYDNISQIPADKRNEITAQVLGPNDTLEGTPQSIMASPTQSGIAVNHGSHDLFNNTYSWDNSIDFSNTNIKPYKIHCGYGYGVWSAYNTVATVNGQQVGYRLVDDYIPADKLMIFDQMGNHLGDYTDSLTHNNSTSPVTINFVSHLSYHTYQLRTNVVYRYNGNDLFTDTFVGKLGDQIKIKYSTPRGFIIKTGQNLPNTVDPARTSQIIVELDQDKAINYRFTDLTDFNNQKMVPTGATNAQGPDWANISGKENVSQYIPGFDFINGIGTDGMSNYGSYQQYLGQLKSMGYDVAHDDTQSFVIDGVMYSPADAKTSIEKKYDDKFNAALQKALARWKADRQAIVDETNGYEKQKQEATQHIMSLADQLRTVSPSSQQHADLFKQITNEHNKISLLDNKIDAAWRRLSNIHFETYMNNDMTSLSVIQGFNHMIDAYSSDNKPSADTKLSSGKTISSMAKDSNIYNASSYGDYTSFKLNLNVLRNANGDTWPPEIDHGPITGFIGPYNTVYTDAHFDDPNYDEIRTGKRDNYQYNLLTGHGYVYSIDDVTGEVTKVLVDGQAMNLPIFYFSQVAGYDLYINGQKVDHGIEHPTISWAQYVNGPHDWTIEYRPLTARVNWKVVDQDGNVLSNGGENVYTDSNSSINGRQTANNFISNYNKSNSNKYAEFISSDIPSGTTVSGQDAADGKIFDYTIRVNVYNRTQVRTSGDTHVRTIYFVNRADPNNSARAITDTVEFDTIKDVFIKDGQKFDIPTQAGGTTIYKAKGSFDDATAKIKAAIGTDNYTVVSGGQYIGAYIPDTPGGDDVTIEYN